MSSSISCPTKNLHVLGIESSTKDSIELHTGLLSPPATPPSKRSFQLEPPTKSVRLHPEAIWSHPGLAKAYSEMCNGGGRLREGVNASGELVSVAFQLGFGREEIGIHQHGDGSWQIRQISEAGTFEGCRCGTKSCTHHWADEPTLGASGYKTFFERRWSGLDGRYIDFSIKCDDVMEHVEVTFEVALVDFYLTRNPTLGWRLMSGPPPTNSNHVQLHSKGPRHTIYQTLLQIVLDRTYFRNRDYESLSQVEKLERTTRLPGLLSLARVGLSPFRPRNICLALLDVAKLETSDGAHLPVWRRSVRAMIAIANSIQHGDAGSIPLFGDLVEVPRANVLPEVLKSYLFIATLVASLLWATLVSPPGFDLVMALVIGSLPIQALFFWVPLKIKVDRRARDSSEGCRTLDTALSQTCSDVELFFKYHIIQGNMEVEHAPTSYKKEDVELCDCHL